MATAQQPPEGALHFPGMFRDRPVPKARVRHHQKIRFKLAEVARSRGLVHTSGPSKGKVNLSAIQQGTGAAYTTLFDMLRHPEQLRGIQWDTLARFCAYLDCQPGDLIEYVPDPETVKYTVPRRDWSGDGADGAIEGWNK